MNESKVKEKSKLVSLILSIIIPGGGLYYINKRKTAIILFYFVIVFYFISFNLTAIFNTAYILALSYIIIIMPILIYSIVIPLIIIYQKRTIKEEYVNNYISLFTIILYILIIFFYNYLLNISPVRAFSIPANSMANTIIKGDIIIARKTKDIKRGDIVIFQYPLNPNIFYVKRCIAFDGDLIALKDKHLLLHPHEGNDFVKKTYKNNQLIEDSEGNLYVVDPYIKKYEGIHHDPSVTMENSSAYKALFNLPIIKIPKKNFFMMGDNREHSNDSRFIGTIPKKFIYGKTNLIFANYTTNKFRFNIKIK